MRKSVYLVTFLGQAQGGGWRSECFPTRNENIKAEISSENRVPSPSGMENIVRAIESRGQFTDSKISFENIADDTLAREAAKELGYRTI